MRLLGRVVIMRASVHAAVENAQFFRFHEYGIFSVIMMSRCVLHLLGENTTNAIWRTKNSNRILVFFSEIGAFII